MHEREVATEADRREQGEPDAGRDAWTALARLARREEDAEQRAPHARELPCRRTVAADDPDCHGNHGGESSDRRDDTHRADHHASVVGVEAERSGHRRRDGEQRRRTCRSVCAAGDE